MAIPMNSYPSMLGSQNSADPHTEQNPRRAFSDERYQVTLSPPAPLEPCAAHLRQQKRGLFAFYIASSDRLQANDPVCLQPRS